MNVHDEFTRRVAADRLCAAVMKAVRDGDAAALGRLGMRGFALYAGRLSELMTECARRRLLGANDFGAIMDEDEDDFGSIMDEDEDDFGAIMDEDEDDFGAIMNEVAKPAHYAHHLVNEGGTAIQQALDRRNGVRLRVIEPEFNDGRLKGIVGEASESDSENATDNLAVQLGTFVKDMGNEFMRQNAEQRDRAGFKVTITRTGGAKCCPWCADRTGKWELANAPDGVFGCHDNCKCMVDYTNSKGTVRGRAVTHKIDGKTVTKWEFADKIPYTPPRVLTREEAAALGAFAQPRRLTGGANGGIIGYNDIVTSNQPIAHDAEKYVPSLDIFGADLTTDPKEKLRLKQLNSLHKKRSQALLIYVRKQGVEAGTEYSMIYNAKMNTITGRETPKKGVVGNVEIPPANEPFHAFHNHGSSEILSITDIRGFALTKNMISITAQGNNGKSKFVLFKEKKLYNFDDYYHFISNKAKETIVSIAGNNYSLNDFADERKKAELETIIDNLPLTQKERIQQAILAKTLECVKGGEKYGVRYISSKA